MKFGKTTLQVTCILLCFWSALNAQNAYFQQDVAYEIRVSLDDSIHMLHGKETLKYQNNSPDTLREFYFHVWPNAYLNNKTAFAVQEFENGSLKFKRGKPETKGGVTGSAFSQEGVRLEGKPYNGQPDILVFELKEPILPGASTTFNIDFDVKIPDSYSRFGHVGQQYQITQWYPKPAVYDRNGWNPMPYLDQGEFYSEYGTFDVYIDIPKNYVVGATGDLPAGDPEWEWLKEREKKSRILLETPLEKAFFEKEFPDQARKTLHFHQERVHDFAWFADKNYYVLSDTVALPQSGRGVRCVAMFTNLDRNLWKEAPRYIAQAVYHYSNWNGDYPYAHATAVDGALSAGAGMEYPNITVLGAGGSAENLEMVTMHEVGHNWYYGILGSNERAYPWMDEGLNTYFEGKYWKLMHGDSMSMIPPALTERLGINFTHTFMERAAYGFVAGTGVDQPIQTHSADFTGTNYGVIAYMKSGLAFNYLEAYLGEKVANDCFHAYFEKWKFKHPGPDDIQAVFEEVSGKDLDWFFDVYLLGIHKPDFKIKGYRDGMLHVSNSATIPMPVPVAMLDREGNVLQSKWVEPFRGDTTIPFEAPDNAFRLRLDPSAVVPEIRDENNLLRTKGIFRHAKPLALHLLYKYPDPTKTNLNIFPVIGYNTTDGFMGGMILHGGFFPKRRFEYHLMPMFGFGTDRVVGSAGFTARWVPSKYFSKIEYHLRASSFSTILRVKNFITADIKPKEVRSNWRHQVVLNSHILARRPEEAPLEPVDWYLPVYGSGVWNIESDGTLGDLNAQLELGGNPAMNMGRLAAEIAYKRKVGKKASFFARGFAGLILSSEEQPFLFQFRASGARDPFGEAVLIDRAATGQFGARQVTRDHGSLSSLNPTASFDQRLLAVNTHFKLPLPVFSVFANAATGANMDGSTGFFYDAGIRINFLKESLHLNFPVLGTTYGGMPADGKAFLDGFNFSFDILDLGNSIMSIIPGS